jgi:hypothetical protein
MGMNLDELKQWMGKTDTLADQMTTTPLKALAATMNREDPAPRSPVGTATRRRAGPGPDCDVGLTRAPHVYFRGLP